jgi:N-methylhydantoinase A
MRFGGPAIVETTGSTFVVHPGNDVSVDDWGNLIVSITLEGAA